MCSCMHSWITYENFDTKNWSMHYCYHLEMFRRCVMHIIPIYLYVSWPATNNFTFHTNYMKKSLLHNGFFRITSKSLEWIKLVMRGATVYILQLLSSMLSWCCSVSCPRIPHSWSHSECRISHDCNFKFCFPRTGTIQTSVERCSTTTSIGPKNYVIR